MLGHPRGKHAPWSGETRVGPQTVCDGEASGQNNCATKPKGSPMNTESMRAASSVS